MIDPELYRQRVARELTASITAGICERLTTPTRDIARRFAAALRPQPVLTNVIAPAYLEELRRCSR